MNNRKTPRIRFKGFTDDWEQRKLGDVLRTLPFKQFLKTPEQGGKYEIIQQGNEPIIGYANGEPCESFRNTVIFGDHTLSLYKPKKPFFVATDGVRILQGTNDMDGYYLLSLLEGNSLKSEGYKRYYSILLDREVLLTENHCEQVQIGLCFKHFDHLITLHQRKLEKLKIVKKAMLENCFPKNGEKVPKFRFFGFTGDWEQRKFSDLVETRRGLTYKPADIREIGVRVLRSSNIDEDCFVRRSDDIFVDVNAINIDFAKENDILITAANGSSRLVGKHTILSDIPDKSTVHGGFMLLGTSEEAYFANALMSSTWYKKFIDLYVSGGNGAIGNLNKRDLDEQDIFIPTKKEQQVIGHYFASFDHLITLHQRK